MGIRTPSSTDNDIQGWRAIKFRKLIELSFTPTHHNSIAFVMDNRNGLLLCMLWGCPSYRVAVVIILGEIYLLYNNNGINNREHALSCGWNGIIISSYFNSTRQCPWNRLWVCRVAVSLLSFIAGSRECSEAYLLGNDHRDRSRGLCLARREQLQVMLCPVVSAIVRDPRRALIHF